MVDRGLIGSGRDCQASRYINNLMTLRALTRNAVLMLLMIIAVVVLLGIVIPANY